LWALPFTGVITLTSVWYFAERAGVDWDTPPPATALPLREQPSGAKVDRWVAAASAAMPGLKITGVSLPSADGDPVVVQGEWRAWLVRERTNAAYIDPVSDRLLGLRVAHAMGPGERIVHTADPLHFGNFAGLGGKLLWSLFGIMLTGLAASGAMIHGKRLATGHEPGLTRSWRRSLGAALVPSLLLILALPAWFFVNSWQTAGMMLMQPAGAVASQSGVVPVYRSLGGSPSWCARPGRTAAAAAFRLSDGTTMDAAFDAGFFCAELPPGRSVTAFTLRSGR
jgi:uncharacterized iron-regulated membrane protein